MKLKITVFESRQLIKNSKRSEKVEESSPIA